MGHESDATLGPGIFSLPEALRWATTEANVAVIDVAGTGHDELDRADGPTSRAPR